MPGLLQRLGNFERRLLAFGLAPLGAGAASLAVQATIYVSGGSPRMGLSHAEESLFMAGAVAMYAAPFAWLAAPLLVALLRHRGWLDFPRVACAGVLLGGGWFLVVVLVELLDSDTISLRREWMLVPIGAWCGFGAAATYWLIGERAPGGRSASPPAG